MEQQTRPLVEHLWTQKLRGELHSLPNWQAADDNDQTHQPLHITYAPTGAGATGHSQLSTFFSKYPNEQHLFSSEQLSRFGSLLTTTSLSIDPIRAVICEELTLSTLHCAQIDWLVPNLPATNKQFQLLFVVIANYSWQDNDREGPIKIKSVHIHWDQGSLLKQLGVLEETIKPYLRGSAFKNVQIEEIVDSLPIANGRQVVLRITNPTVNNANFILPLDLKLDSKLKASQGNGSKRGGGAYRHLLPIGGLDAMNQLLSDLPGSPASNCKLTTKPINAALVSKLFQEPSEEPAQSKQSSSSALKSQLVFSDESDRELFTGRSAKTEFKDNIFNMANGPVNPPKPSITVDPKRNDSNIFDSTPQPFVPTITIDKHRLESHLFDERDETNQDPRLLIKVNSKDPRFLSTIFANESPQKSATLHTKAHKNSQATSNISHFQIGDDSDDSIEPNQARGLNKGGCRTNLNSHIFDPESPIHPVEAKSHTRKLASQFQFGGDGEEHDAIPLRKVLPNHNSSTIIFGSDSDEAIKAQPKKPTNPRAYQHNKSQLDFEADPPAIVKPSLRVSKPPGGESSIIF